MAISQMKIEGGKRDLEQASEELSISSARFVRKEDLPLGKQYVFTGIKRLQKDRLICVNYGYIFLVGTEGKSKGIVCSMRLENYRLFDVAVFSKNICFVTARCDSYQIPEYFLNQIGLKDDKSFSLEKRSMETDCYGIDILSDKVAISFTDMVAIQNIKGHKTSAVTFSMPYIIHPESVNRKVRPVSFVEEHGRGVVYVSDQQGLDRPLVTKLSETGDVINCYTNWEYTTPSDIAATGDGHLIMCFFHENCIRVLVPDMSRVVTILEEKDGIKYPLAICYCQEDRKMFISNAEADSLLVFEVL